MKRIRCVFILCLFIASLSFALEEEKKQRPNVEYKADNLRDPFQTYVIEKKKAEAVQAGTSQPEEESVTPPALTVQGIIWGGRFPQAIINNKVVRVGDIIEEAEITDISKEGVIITFKNRQFNLSSPAAVKLEGLKKKSEGGQNENH